MNRDETLDLYKRIGLLKSQLDQQNELLSRVKTTLRFLEVRVPVINSEREVFFQTYKNIAQGLLKEIEDLETVK